MLTKFCNLLAFTQERFGVGMACSCGPFARRSVAEGGFCALMAHNWLSGRISETGAVAVPFGALEKLPAEISSRWFFARSCLALGLLSAAFRLREGYVPGRGAFPSLQSMGRFYFREAR